MKRVLSKLNKTTKVLLIILMIGLLPFAAQWLLKQYHVWTYSDDLSHSFTVPEIYETVANVCLRYAEQNPSESGLVWFVASNDILSTYIWENGDVSEVVDVPMTEQEKGMLIRIRSMFSFHQNQLETIRVKDGYVSFCAYYKTPASIIYSPNDTKPDFLYYSGEEREYVP